MPFAATWMDLEIVIQSEVKSGRESEISQVITYMWNLKKIIKMNLFTKQKQTSQTQRMNLWLPGEP